MSKKIKAVLAISAALIVFVAGAVIFSQLADKLTPENKSIIVYKQGGETVVSISGISQVLTENDFAEFKADEENERVFFTVASAYSDGLFDLYYIEKSRSEISKPKIIDYGIDGSFDVVSGKVYYLKRNINEGAFEGCYCDVDKGTIEAFASNAESIYAMNGTDKIYFTKLHGTNRVLYSYFKGVPSEICRELKTAIVYNDTETPHIIFEKKSLVNTGMSELYIAYGEEEPQLICDNTYSVMYDYYQPDGNLYYFTSGTESISWSYVIADRHSETDKNMTRPSRLDYFDVFGISEGYNNALSEYHDKLLRDEIREALDETMAQGGFAAPIFNAFAFNSQGTFKIAENIDPNNVYTVSAMGEPKIIFESTQVVSSDIDLTTLVEYSQRNQIDDVIEYAQSIVNESVKSKGMAYAAYGENGAVTSTLEGYDKSRTLFSFSKEGSRIFAFVRNLQGDKLDLYTNSLNVNLMPSAVNNIDTGITSYRFVGDSVIYLKADIGKNTGDVFAFDGNEKTKVSNAVNAFTVENFEDIIVLKGHDVQASQPTADYYYCTDSGEKLLGENVVVSSFKYSKNGKAAYITGTNDGNRLCIGNNKNCSVIAENVSEILLFK